MDLSEYSQGPLEVPRPHFENCCSRCMKRWMNFELIETVIREKVDTQEAKNNVSPFARHPNTNAYWLHPQGEDLFWNIKKIFQGCKWAGFTYKPSLIEKMAEKSHCEFSSGFYKCYKFHSSLWALGKSMLSVLCVTHSPWRQGCCPGGFSEPLQGAVPGLCYWPACLHHPQVGNGRSVSSWHQH